jgi:hypothetical protein
MLHRDSDSSEDCSICWDSVELGGEITVLACSHSFHLECINQWCRVGDNCPLCRRRLSETQCENASIYCDDSEDQDIDEVVLVGDGVIP